MGARQATPGNEVAYLPLAVSPDQNNELSNYHMPVPPVILELWHGSPQDICVLYPPIPLCFGQLSRIRG